MLLFTQIALLISVATGIILIIISLIAFKNEKNNPSTYFEASNTIKAIETSINEMDSTMNEFEEMSKLVFQEIDDKYQELLFLYSLLDEKKTEITSIYGETVTSVAKPVKIDVKINDDSKFDNPKLLEINALKNEGLSVPEIAKRLDMGQGEVKLILELGKMR